MRFVSGKRFPQIDPETKVSLDSRVSHEGDIVVTNRNGHFRVVGTSKDPFGADKIDINDTNPEPEPKQIHEVEEQVDERFYGKEKRIS